MSSMDVDVSGSVRGLPEVDRVVGLAKLDPGDLAAQSQALSFARGDLLDTRRQVLLLEVDADQAALLESGGALTLRGRPDDGAAICGSGNGATFEVKEAETSNSLLLARGVRLPEHGDCGEGEREVVAREVLGVAHTYLELRRCRPRLARLRQELGAVGSKTDFREGNYGKTMSALLDEVQASREELEAALKDLDACKTDNGDEGPSSNGDNARFFLLDVPYRMKLVQDALNFAEENSWPLSGVLDRDETVRALAELEPEELVQQVFDQHFPGGRVDAAKLRRLCGEYLLRAGNLLRLEDFLTAWRASLPDGVLGDDETLQILPDLAGLAVAVDGGTGSNGTIRYFPESSLPSESVADRLRALFAAKERWTVEEAAPYVEPFTSGKLDARALLAKHARAASEGGVKYFSAKHGK